MMVVISRAEPLLFTEKAGFLSPTAWWAVRPVVTARASKAVTEDSGAAAEAAARTTRARALEAAAGTLEEQAEMYHRQQTVVAAEAHTACTRLARWVDARVTAMSKLLKYEGTIR